jgi:predicted permease
VETLLQDARYAFRMQARNPGFALVAVLTLALGIGANTAVMGALRAVFLRPLPYPHADRLLHLWATWPGGAGNFSYPDYQALVAQSRSLESVAAYEPWGTVTLAGRGAPVALTPSFVTPSYLEMLGAQTAAGRLFSVDDDAPPRGQPVVLLSHGLWQRQFGGDPGIVGRAIPLNGTALTVVGVLTPGFRDLGAVDGAMPEIWLPTAAAPTLLGQPPLTDTYRIYWGLARLRPGVTLAQARDDVAAIAGRMERERPESHRGYRLEAQALAQRVHGRFGGPTLLVLGGSAFILLIGCANIANLLLARMASRRREIALRSALGASAARVLRQLLVECGVLAACGGALGALLAAWITSSLRGFVHDSVSAFVDLEADAWLLASSLALILFATLTAGLAPALEAARMDVRTALASGGRDAAGGGRSLTRRFLVAAEIAFALVVLMGAGLMVRSFRELTASTLGFRTEDLLTFRMDLTGPAYADAAARTRFVDAFVERASAVPGVESATVWGPSILGRATWVVNLVPQGRPADTPDAFTMVFRHSVNPAGLGNLGIPLLRGRDFTAADTDRAPLVAIVSESVAREFWPGEEALGRTMRRQNPSLPAITVVGVAADVHHRQRYDLADIAEGFGGLAFGPQRDVYLPYAQRPNNAVTAGVRVRSAPPGVLSGLRAAVASLDAELALCDVQLLDERLRRQETAPGAIAALLAAYAGLALSLAALGVAGVVAHGVSRRTREIGIRMAVGARGRDVVLMIVREALVVAGVGLVAGLGAALAVGRAMQSLLFGVAPSDPSTFGAIGLLLVAVSAVAAYLPARRATRVDPMLALRAD